MQRSRARRRRRGWRASTSPPQRRASSRAIGSPRPVPGGPCGPGGAAAVEAGEHLGLFLAGREAGPVVEHLDPRPDGAQHHVAARGRVGDRVLDEHVERAVEVGARGPGVTGLRRPTCSVRCRRRRAAPSQRSARVGDGVCEVDAARAGRRPRRPARARAARRPSRDRRSSSRRPASISSWASAIGGRGAGLLQPQPQPAERRAELVRGVGDELALARRRSRSSRAVMSLNVRASRCCSALPSTLGARRQVALGHAARGLVEPAAPGRPPGRRSRAPSPSPSTSTSAPIAISPSVARQRGAVDGFDALRHAHGARRLARAGGGPARRSARIVSPSVSLRRCSLARGRRASAGRDLRAACCSRCRAARRRPSRRPAGRPGRRRSRGRAPPRRRVAVTSLEPSRVRSSSSTRRRDELGLAAAPAT